MSELVEVLVFEVDRQLYGLPISAVKEVTRAAWLLPLTNAPPIVEGVLNFRGRIIPVLNFRARFGLTMKPITHTEHLVIAETGEREVAIRADRAVNFLKVQVENNIDLLKNVEYVAGIAKLEDGLLLIHDLDTFLNKEESAAIDRAMAKAKAAGVNP